MSQDSEKKCLELLAKLHREDFEGQLRSLYGADEKPKDSYIAKIGFDAAANRLGWTMANVNWILERPNLLEQVLEDAVFIRSKFSYVIFCGMGGSGLSVQLVKDMFEGQALKIYSLRTTDPRAIKDILEEITSLESSLQQALKKTLVIPISKSGTTVETISHKQYFESLFAKFLIDTREHMWVLTDKNSPMDTGEYQQREIQLNKRGDIGGRFTSPTTRVFLLPLAILAPERFKGIFELVKEINDKDTKEDVFLQLGVFLYYMAAQEGKDKVTLFMPADFADIPMWAEQLFEESLGKDNKGVTLFYGERISEDDLRAVKASDRVFVRINVAGVNVRQQLWSYLEKQKFPLFEISVESADALGGVMLGLQRAVAAIAYLWGICFVDQPAVEGYKKATRKIIQEIHPGEEVGVPKYWEYASFNSLKVYYTPLIEAGIISRQELENEVIRLSCKMDDAAGVSAAIISLMRIKKNFQAMEITSYGKMCNDMRNILEEARYHIFTDMLKMPSKLGEGPDKNHSYHQNIEAGKDMWLSMYFLAREFLQPQELEFDANLLKAQAIGTVNSLIQRKRGAMLIVFSGKADESLPDLRGFFNQLAKFPLQ